MEAAIADEPATVEGWHPCYSGFFRRFNLGEYYEAHDILEHLWLRSPEPIRTYYKGLIQFAGAFVHLQKQYARPTHPKDGRRLYPAARLFALAAQNASAFSPEQTGLSHGFIGHSAASWRHTIIMEGYQRNPWRPDALPTITLNAR